MTSFPNRSSHVSRARVAQGGPWSRRLPTPRRLFARLLVAAAVVGSASTAGATGYGIYLDYALGPINRIDTPDVSTSNIGVGFTLDTAVARNALFNYRFNLGYERVRLKASSTEVDLNGASLEQIFGFGVYRTKHMRVWLGPSLRIAGAAAENPNGLSGTSEGSVLDIVAGGGISAGINVHTGRIGSAAFTIGYQYNFLGLLSINDNAGGNPYLPGTEQRVNFNFAYYFRGAGDVFE